MEDCGGFTVVNGNRHAIVPHTHSHRIRSERSCTEVTRECFTIIIINDISYWQMTNVQYYPPAGFLGILLRGFPSKEKTLCVSYSISLLVRSKQKAERIFSLFLALIPMFAACSKPRKKLEKNSSDSYASALCKFKLITSQKGRFLCWCGMPKQCFDG